MRIKRYKPTQSVGVHIRMIHKVLFLTGCLLFSQASSASTQLQCTIVYSLKGLSHQTFNQQINDLASHLKRLKIGLVDMNQWQDTSPHIRTSGREKALMRKKYVMSKFNNSAVVLDRHGDVISRYENTAELVDMIMRCKQHNARTLSKTKNN